MPQIWVSIPAGIQRSLWDSLGSDIELGLMQEFVVSIRENRDPIVIGYDGMKAVETVIAAYLSGE
jgi:hypothetical protein